MTPTLPSPLKGEGLGGDENANHIMLWAISNVMHYINVAYTNYESVRGVRVPRRSQVKNSPYFETKLSLTSLD